MFNYHEMLKTLVSGEKDSFPKVKQFKEPMTPEQLLTFVKRYIYKKGITTRRMVLTNIYQYGATSAAALDSVIPEILNHICDIQNENGMIIARGRVIQQGDGKKGTLGNGSISYIWIPLDEFNSYSRQRQMELTENLFKEKTK